MVSKAREDLPEPLILVMTINLFLGSSKSIFLRLCSLAPLIILSLSNCISPRFLLVQLTVFSRRLMIKQAKEPSLVLFKSCFLHLFSSIILSLNSAAFKVQLFCFLHFFPMGFYHGIQIIYFRYVYLVFFFIFQGYCSFYYIPDT